MLVGFKTSEVSAAAQSFFLTKPPQEVRAKIAEWEADPNVRTIVCDNPEPFVEGGHTHWMFQHHKFRQGGPL